MESSVSISDAIASFYEDGRYAHSIQGAESAWRGFEQQTLYICSRIINSVDESCQFLPETVEDLLVIHNRAEDEYIEIVQVKSKQAEKLSLSDLGLGNKDSFFGRIYYFYSRCLTVKPAVALFGQLGDELSGLANGDIRSKRSVQAKIEKVYDIEFAKFAVDAIKLEVLDEEDVQSSVISVLRQAVETRIAPQMFLSDLAGWVRKCSRFRLLITLDGFNARVRSLRERLAAISGFENQYGKTIFPLSERTFVAGDDMEYEQEYRLGASATYEHILLSLDIPRSSWLQTLSDAFESSDVVVVQGASGQGKSSLCFRFLVDYTSRFTAYLIRGLSDMGDARDIASCAAALAEQSESVPFFYIDDASGDAWTWLAEQLSQRCKGRFKLLVSARNEEMNRSSLSQRKCSFRTIHLELCRDEAQLIYELYPHGAFPSFEESWMSFGGRGPLMEYTSSLGSTKSLAQMLESQVAEFVRDSDDAWIEALLITSLAGSEGLSVDLDRLKRVTKCGNLNAFVQRVNEEHLVRLSEPGVLAPYHPFRSSKVYQALIDAVRPNEHHLLVSLVACAKGNIATSLVRFFETRLPAGADVENFVANVESWNAASEVLKFALWADTRSLFLSTATIRESMNKDGFQPSFVFMLSGGVSGENKSFASDALLDAIADDSRRAALRRHLDLAGGINVEYELTNAALNALLRRLGDLPQPSNARDLNSAGFVLTQFAAHGDSLKCADCVQGLLLSLDYESGPLDEMLDSIMASCLCGAVVDEANIEVLAKRIDKRAGVVWRRIEDGRLDIILAPKEQHDSSIEYCLVDALCDYRRLAPHLEYYCGKVAGVGVFVSPDRMPPIVKEIPAANLPLYWRTVVDPMFLAMCAYEEAPEDWSSLKAELSHVYGSFCAVVKLLMKEITSTYEKGRFSGLSKRFVEVAKKAETTARRANVGIPKTALDEQGFCQYQSAIDVRQTRGPDRSSVANQRPQPDRFASVRSNVSKIDTFLQSVALPFQFMAEGRTDNWEQKARISLVNLIDICMDCSETAALLSGVFDGCIIDRGLEGDLLLLCVLWSTACFAPLKKTPCFLKSQKKRVRRISSASKLYVDYAKRLDGLSQIELRDSSITVVCEIPMLVESIDVVLAEGIVQQINSLDKPLFLPERIIIPKAIGDIEVCCTVEGYYYASSNVSAVQLLFGVENEKEALFRPLKNPDAPIIARRSPVLDACIALDGIKADCSYWADVNMEILANDKDVRWVSAEAYENWKSDIANDVSRLCKVVQLCLDDALPSLREESRQTIESLEEIAIGMLSCADCSPMDEIIDDLKNTVLSHGVVPYEKASALGDVDALMPR